VPTITAKAKFAYTGNQGASLSGYSVNTSTGVLTPLSGFPLVAGLNPTVVTHDPQNRFLIVGDIAANMLHILAINSTTGALTEVNPSPYTTVKEPVSLIVDPAGTHVYVASQGSNQVGAYSLSSTGVLTAISGSPFASGGTQNFGDSLTVNAAGTFLYLQDTVNIYAFGINATSGALTLLQTVTGPVQGGGLALDPAGTYLYAVGSGTDSILTLTKSSAMLELNGAYTIAVSPTGQFTYTIENNDFLVSYAISNGAFTPEGAPYSGVYGQQIGIDPSGSFVYAPQACSNCPSGVYNVVNEFSIGATGALTKLSGSPVAAGTTPWGITITTQ
jgi:6-phosphogluconolactonase (cycloisomerase 2 family)